LTAAIPRPAARVVLLDPDDRVLLFKFTSPASGRTWWLTPGGGLDPGETHEEAALREVAEECGLSWVAFGPCIWEREVEFAWRDALYLQQERYFVARVLPFEVSSGGQTDEELEVLGEYRWWSVREIQASQEVFAPRRLGELLAAFLRDGIPPEPVDAGV